MLVELSTVKKIIVYKSQVRGIQFNNLAIYEAANLLGHQ